MKQQNINRFILEKSMWLMEGLSAWIDNPDSSLATILRQHFIKRFGYDFFKEASLDIKDSIWDIVSYTQIMMCIQYFVYTFQISEKKILDDINSNNKFKEYKLKIDVNNTLKTVNATQLIKVLRESFCHNDDSLEKPNWEIDFSGVLSINHLLKKGRIINVRLKALDLVEIANIYRQYLDVEKINNDSTLCEIDVWETKLKNFLNANRIDKKNIHKFIEEKKHSLNKTIIMDDFPKNALINFFKTSMFSIKEQLELNLSPISAKYLATIFPSKSNPVRLANDLLYTGNIIWHIIGNYNSFDKFKKSATAYFNENICNNSNLANEYFYFLFNNRNKLISVILSNLLFDIFSTISTDQLTYYFSNINVQRLRNSIMHARYYYNFDGAFEFYDGRNDEELEHILILKFDDIYSIVQNIINDYYHEQQQKIGN